jgi:CheY-like chemotaxis protein/copper chaperone CopZ
MSAINNSNAIAPIGEDHGVSPQNRKMTVMIVDDDHQIARILRLLFEVESFNVVGEASNGAEACEMALQHKPDFAILDYRLPGIDGEQAAACLRTLVPETKIIAFSAILDHKPAWADAYVNKSDIAGLTGLVSNGTITSRGLILSADLRYLHALPGRLRLKIIEAKGDPSRARQIESLLRAVEGVTRAKVSSTTGNALIAFDARKVGLTDFLATLRAAGYLAETAKPVESASNEEISALDSPATDPSIRTKGFGLKLTEKVVVSTVEIAMQRIVQALI